MVISKAFKVAILALLILLIGSFDFFRIAARGSESNYFNKNLRYIFARSPLMRDVLQLRDFGDDRADYLGSAKSKISLEVYTMAGLKIDQAVLQDLAKDISKITAKPVTVKIQTQLAYRSVISESEVNQIFKNDIISGPDPSTAYLYLLILSAEATQPNLLGSTYNANAILVFNNPLADFTVNVPDTFNDYQLSTALHEFGHQLGLDHNDQPGCLMNPKAETNGVPRSSPQDVVVYFCPFETALIKNIKF